MGANTKLKDNEDDIEEDDESGVDIEIVDDTPEADKGKKTAEITADSPVEDDNDEEIKSLSKRVRDRISTLTARYHQERRAKEAAARQIDEQANLLKKTVEDRNRLTELVNKGEGFWKETNKSKAEAQLAVAKREFRDAYDAGDAEKLAEAQQKITKYSIELENTIRWNPEPIRKTEVPKVQEAPRQTDPKAADWHSKNNWFGTDNRLTAYALGLHQELVEKGVKPDTEDYYKNIDTEMRTAFPDKFPKPQGERGSARASVVAPAGRDTNKGSRKVVRLTTSQVEIAKRLGLTNKQYVDAMLEMENNDQ